MTPATGTDAAPGAAPGADLAARALACWDLPVGAAARPLNVAENLTYLVTAPGLRRVLRLHRPGYHDARAIESEVTWIGALRTDGRVAVPHPRRGRDGAFVQAVPEAAGQLATLFDFHPGTAPDADGDLVPGFEALGAIAAACHAHAAEWPRPAGFVRPAWDLEAVFGPAAPWGDWRAAPHLSPDDLRLLDRAQRAVSDRIDAYGMGPDRHGLIHADMRLANLLVADGAIRLIDFDDCGFGWLLYDFAAAVSFIETDPRLPDLKAAWLRGYGVHRAPPPEADEMADAFVMLRRFALLAWIASRADAPEPRAMAPHFAAGTVALATRWLRAGSLTA